MLTIIMQTSPTGAGAGAGATGGLMAQLLPFILIGLVFYFLLIRPQNKRMKEHREMLNSVSRGDTIVTNGGLIGKVVKVTDDELTLDIGSGNKVKVVRSMITTIMNKTGAPANDTGNKKSKK